MSIFPKNIEEAANKIGGDWVKGAEFDGEGLTLQLIAPMEVVKSPMYGATETDWLVKNEIIGEGETLRFHFKDASGKERKHDTTSTPFFIAFKQVEELNVGDWVQIARTGKTDKTRYTVVKVDAPVLAAPETVSQDGIPF